MPYPKNRTDVWYVLEHKADGGISMESNNEIVSIKQEIYAVLETITDIDTLDFFYKLLLSECS